MLWLRDGDEVCLSVSVSVADVAADVRSPGPEGELPLPLPLVLRATTGPRAWQRPFAVELERRANARDTFQGWWWRPLLRFLSCKHFRPSSSCCSFRSDGRVRRVLLPVFTLTSRKLPRKTAPPLNLRLRSVKCGYNSHTTDLEQYETLETHHRIYLAKHGGQCQINRYYCLPQRAAAAATTTTFEATSNSDATTHHLQ